MAEYSKVTEALLGRRRWLRQVSMASLGSLVPLGCQREAPAPTAESLELNEMRFPGKIPMRVINSRPPCLETPWRYFRSDFTPNEAFYVRWHLQMLPTEVDPRRWRLTVGGEVKQPLRLSLRELREFEPVTIAAVNQCSGNSRALADPRVPGAQWENGAMGNARWTGVPLETLLERAGIKAGAVEVTFRGLDRGGIQSVPDFVRSLKVELALDSDILVAYAMNGEPLPMLNGFPARLVVPGWYATWWIKSLSEITVVDKPFTGFWMDKAYRIPTTPNAVETPDNLATETVPISRMNVRSFFTFPDQGTVVTRHQPCSLEGFAFDGGSGIRLVELSADSGKTWQAAKLGTDHGNYSFRRWHHDWTPTPGRHVLLVRATSNKGEQQPLEPGWNHAGYMRNVVEQLALTVS
ncbi:TMAO/DMSO reductase [Planctomycetes bacterium Pan216]|uniref:TMAO/DMSO reductase n=1 Tax=Kolteria novifilia TaxID=2527975 RepID=A0A518B776_9BACT|nr:TMAO/DMSO reductase [Planctomycetes bacterium Pan216]